MQGYEDDLDEEVGYDDYYSGDEDEEQDYEEEEERQPPKEELEYLELRQKLKDSLRKSMGKETTNAQSSQVRRKKLPYNDFGSFFGPSRPVISSRVIQESKSLIENEIRTSRMSNSNQIKKKPVLTSGSDAKAVLHKKRPIVVNEMRRKVEALKDTRDYSFLLSDDAELPVLKKVPLSRSGSFPSSQVRSAQVSARPKQSPGINREEKRPVSGNGHLRPASSGSQMNRSRPVSSGSQMQQRTASSGNQRPGSLTNRQTPMRAHGSTANGQSSNRNGQPISRLDSQRSATAKVTLDDHRRKQISSSSNGVGPGRSAGVARPLISKTSLERKPSISAGKSSLQSAQIPSSSRPMSSDPRQRVVEQRKVSRDFATSRLISKQSASTSKHQIMNKPAPKRPPPRVIDDYDRRPKKKKPVRMSEDAKALDMIRKMFRSDRYYGRDDDDINMEANFEDIQKEERRSARIARDEDAKEAELIAREEEEERRRKLSKNRKLSH